MPVPSGTPAVMAPSGSNVGVPGRGRARTVNRYPFWSVATAAVTYLACVAFWSRHT